jgi:hypothetical protein
VEPAKLPEPMKWPAALKSAVPMLGLVVVLAVFAEFLAAVQAPLIQYIQNNNLQNAPLGNSPQGQGVSAFLYLLPLVPFTFGIAYVIKKRKRFVMPALIVFSYSITTWFVLTAVYWWAPAQQAWALVVVLASLFTIGLLAREKKWSGLFRVPFLVWIGTGTAMVLITLFPMIMVLSLCGIAAVWDLYAVLRGPLKTVATAAKNDQTNKIRLLMMVTIGGSSLGLGDVVFYSILLGSAALLSASYLIAAFLGIYVGLAVTFVILRTRPRVALPGLPIPVALSLVAMLLVHSVL